VDQSPTGALLRSNAEAIANNRCLAALPNKSPRMALKDTEANPKSASIDTHGRALADPGQRCRIGSPAAAGASRALSLAPEPRRGGEPGRFPRRRA
jgi:hypothetical protein